MSKKRPTRKVFAKYYVIEKAPKFKINRVTGRGHLRLPLIQQTSMYTFKDVINLYTANIMKQDNIEYSWELLGVSIKLSNEE